MRSLRLLRVYGWSWTRVTPVSDISRRVFIFIFIFILGMAPRYKHERENEDDNENENEDENGSETGRVDTCPWFLFILINWLVGWLVSLGEKDEIKKGGER